MRAARALVKISKPLSQVIKSSSHGSNKDKRQRRERLKSSEVQVAGERAMKETYDAVVSGCLGLLKTATHEMRRTKGSR